MNEEFQQALKAEDFTRSADILRAICTIMAGPARILLQSRRSSVESLLR